MYTFNSQGLSPENKILPRLARYWTLQFVGTVRKIALRDRDLFFNDENILPFASKPEMWSVHDPELTGAILDDPDIESRVISFAHAEI